MKYFYTLKPIISGPQKLGLYPILTIFKARTWSHKPRKRKDARYSQSIRIGSRYQTRHRNIKYIYSQLIAYNFCQKGNLYSPCPYSLIKSERSVGVVGIRNVQLGIQVYKGIGQGQTKERGCVGLSGDLFQCQKFMTQNTYYNLQTRAQLQNFLIN